MKKLPFHPSFNYDGLYSVAFFLFDVYSSYAPPVTTMKLWSEVVHISEGISLRDSATFIQGYQSPIQSRRKPRRTGPCILH